MKADRFSVWKASEQWCKLNERPGLRRGSLSQIESCSPNMEMLRFVWGEIKQSQFHFALL